MTHEEMIQRVSTPSGCDEMAALLAHPTGSIAAALATGLNVLDWEIRAVAGARLFVRAEDRTRPLPATVLPALETERDAFRATETEGRALLASSYHNSADRRRRDEIQNTYNSAARAARNAMEAAGLGHLLSGYDANGYTSMYSTAQRNNVDRVPLSGILVVNAPESERATYEAMDADYPVTVIMQPRAVVAV